MPRRPRRSRATSTWGGTRVRVDRGDGGRPGCRRRLAVRTQPHAGGEHRRRLRRPHGGGDAAWRRLREAAGANRCRGEADQDTRRRGRSKPRLSREPALRARSDPGTRAALAARRRPDRPALSGARRRGAQRAAHAMVLARRPAGRRCAERHDVPLDRGGASSADGARRAARVDPTAADHGPHRLAEVDAARLSRQAAANHGRARQLPRAPGRGLRQRHGRVRGGRRRAPDRRGQHLVELRGRRAPAEHGAARARVLDVPSTRSTAG